MYNNGTSFPCHMQQYAHDRFILMIDPYLSQVPPSISSVIRASLLFMHKIKGLSAGLKLGCEICFRAGKEGKDSTFT